jgi:hypothetical protein
MKAVLTCQPVYVLAIMSRRHDERQCLDTSTEEETLQCCHTRFCGGKSLTEADIVLTKSDGNGQDLIR